jgi:hypothetical protein
MKSVLRSYGLETSWKDWLFEESRKRLDFKMLFPDESIVEIETNETKDWL